MDYESMNREELLKELLSLHEYMSNVIVFWGDRKSLWSMFNDVARNEADEFTNEEAQNAKYIVETEGAFEEFVRLLQDSFDRGGIYHAISEKMSYIMDEVARNYQHGKSVGKEN